MQHWNACTCIPHRQSEYRTCNPSYSEHYSFASSVVHEVFRSQKLLTSLSCISDKLLLLLLCLNKSRSLSSADTECLEFHACSDGRGIQLHECLTLLRELLVEIRTIEFDVLDIHEARFQLSYVSPDQLLIIVLTPTLFAFSANLLKESL